MKLFWKISAALAAVLALLFTVYMLNLDMKQIGRASCRERV